MGCSGLPKGRGIAENQETKLSLKPTQGQGFAEIPAIQKNTLSSFDLLKFLYLSPKLVVELSKLTLCLSSCSCTCSHADAPPEVLIQSVNSEW